jgi:hypothetical protein
MKNEKFCSQLSTCFKRHVGFRGKEIREQEDFQALLRAGGEAETAQENIQDGLQLEGEDPGFQLLKEEGFAAMIFFIYFHRNYLYY